MANLTKKYKTVKYKLRTTGYGKGGDNEHEDKETESGAELIPRNFHDMDNTLGNREAVNPKHELESSSQHVESSLKFDQDLLEKDNEEIWAAARAQKERDTPDTSGADGSEEEDADLAFAKSLLFKHKTEKRKGPITSTPNPKSRAVESAKSAKKNPRKKTSGEAQKHVVHRPQNPISSD
ncbi:hypothetical protein AWC38_SpisGene22441 [Stylophora pistillata]|uniref:Uncharacterized protein n=1 Tax=Stylophora pistillata TaxID=50429 RepID=A0A2B4RAE1_STYPI|nr:hypothetical protein AWC38_SpisGene22441 [Stylophora pistillata]